MSRGGARSGAGAPLVPDQKKKKSVTITFRPDHIEFMRGQRKGWSAKFFEKCLDLEIKRMSGKARLKNVLTGDIVNVHATTDSVDSSYGLECWVDDDGNSYGQCQFGAPFGFEFEGEDNGEEI